MQTKTVEAIVDLLNSYMDGSNQAMHDDCDALSEAAVEEGIVNLYLASGYTVPGVGVPESPVISPATIKLIETTLAINAVFPLEEGCMALNIVRNGLIRDGLVDKQPEAPAAPVEWLGDDFDI
jgi:hypothetical protein